MACPQCQSDEISPAGVCLICGYLINDEAAEPKAEAAGEDVRSHPGPIEVNYSEGPDEPSEKSPVPPWRQQLSQRLHEIKQKKESMTAVPQERKSSPASPVSQAKTAESLDSLQERLRKMPVRRPPVPPVPLPRQKTLEPLPEPALNVSSPPVQSTGPQEIRNLIDSAVLRQTPQSASASGTAQTAAGAPESAPDGGEGKLILLSRTLSGLIDLIVVVLCTGILIIAADYFSGIVALDYKSLLVFSLVFLLIFFLYSLLFLSTSNQTIGMMITDLRVVGADDKRPRIGQILGRSSGFLLSLGFAGIGLLLGIFDRENSCFHDRISDTHVVRL